MRANASTVASLSTLVGCTAEMQQQRQRQSRLLDEGLSDAKIQDLSSSPIHFGRLVMPGRFHNFQVISSYNGIVCLADHFGSAVFLWNPSIRRFKTLPSFKPYAIRKIPVKIGFCYDSISNDYKVIRIVYGKFFDVVPIVQVYSTNADIWREFQAPILRKWKIYKQTNIVVNGVMYFDGGNELISFDLHNDIFGLVPFPSFNPRKGSDVLDFEGFVAMVFESVDYGRGLDLWVLDNFSGEVSWTERFSIKSDWDTTDIWLYSYLGAGQFYGCNLMNRIFFSCMTMMRRKRPHIMNLEKRTVSGLSNTQRHLFHWTALSKWSKMATKSVSWKKQSTGKNY